MMKVQLLLLTLIVAFAVTSCTADARDNTAVATTAATAALATTQPAIPEMTQETAPVTQQDAAAPEVPATASMPTEAPTPTEAPAAAPLPVIGPAPDWENEVWINSDGPIPLEELRGKVVLLEFWTFG